MTYDTKQLENLGGYQPLPMTAVIRALEQPELPTSAPPATLGMNSHVIKPESRVNKAETDLPGREHHKDCECGNCPEKPIKTGVAIPESEADKLLYETLGPTCKTCGRVFE